jgi:hypothetical protein
LYRFQMGVRCPPWKKKERVDHCGGAHCRHWSHDDGDVDR